MLTQRRAFFISTLLPHAHATDTPFARHTLQEPRVDRRFDRSNALVGRMAMRHEMGRDIAHVQTGLAPRVEDILNHINHHQTFNEKPPAEAGG